MTSEEAKTVLHILASADGGCDECAGKLFADFLNKFGFEAEVNQIWHEKFGGYGELEPE